MEFLRPTQIPHVTRILKLFESSPFSIDVSVMGSGKTHTSIAIAAILGIPVIICGPRGSLTYWQKVADTMGVEVILTVTYESLRSTVHCQPKHGLLHRFDYEEGKGVDFAPTDLLRQYIDDGVLIIADEFQKLKNNTSQSKAFRSLVSPIFETGGHSRILLLSGSPFDKEEHAKTFFRMIGFIHHKFLYTIDREGTFVPHGIDELIGSLSYYCPDATEDLLVDYSPLSKKNIGDFIFTAFTDIIVPNFSSAMSSPAIDRVKDVGNGYYYLDTEEEERHLLACINRLQDATAFNSSTQQVSADNTAMGEITKALLNIEQAKIPIFTRVTKERLLDNPKCKVIIFVNYTNTILTLKENLAEFEPLVYDGSVKTQKAEDAVIDAFQNGGRRLILANMNKGGVTISLHDLKGDEPRYSFLSPNYSLLSMHQASARTFRDGLMSDAVIRVVYGLIGTGETRILESKILAALSRKTDNLKRILTLQVEEGVLFPGEYPEILEEKREEGYLATLAKYLAPTIM